MNTKDKELPKHPADVVDLAIRCLKEVEMDDDYVVDMWSWHEGKYELDIGLNIGTQSFMPCEVCFAGSVKAKFDHISPRDSWSPPEFNGNMRDCYREYGLHEDEIRDAIIGSLDGVREGDPRLLIELCGFEHNLEEEGLAWLPSVRKYRAGRNGFMEDMGKMSDWIRENTHEA